MENQRQKWPELLGLVNWWMISSLAFHRTLMWFLVFDAMFRSPRVFFVCGVGWSGSFVVTCGMNSYGTDWNQPKVCWFTAKDVQWLTITGALRILGPSNGRVWTCIAGARVLKIAIFEESAFLGWLQVFFYFYHIFFGKWSKLTCADFSNGLVQPPPSWLSQ